MPHRLNTLARTNSRTSTFAEAMIYVARIVSGATDGRFCIYTEQEKRDAFVACYVCERRYINVCQRGRGRGDVSEESPSDWTLHDSPPVIAESLRRGIQITLRRLLRLAFRALPLADSPRLALPLIVLLHIAWSCL